MCAQYILLHVLCGLLATTVNSLNSNEFWITIERASVRDTLVWLNQLESSGYAVFQSVAAGCEFASEDEWQAARPFVPGSYIHQLTFADVSRSRCSMSMYDFVSLFVFSSIADDTGRICLSNSVNEGWAVLWRRLEYRSGDYIEWNAWRNVFSFLLIFDSFANGSISITQNECITEFAATVSLHLNVEFSLLLNQFNSWSAATETLSTRDAFRAYIAVVNSQNIGN